MKFDENKSIKIDSILTLMFLCDNKSLTASTFLSSVAIYKAVLWKIYSEISFKKIILETILNKDFKKHYEK